MALASSTPALPPSQPAARHPPTPPHKVLEETEKQWLFSEEDLRRTPSVLDGMTPDTERELRGKGVNFISQVGIMLKLPQLTLSTAAVFFNRFLMRNSLVDKPGRKALHHYQVAATAVFLATKVEENCRKVKELVIACCRVAQKNANLIVDEQSKDYWRWKDTILLNEDVLLENLCFDLTIDPPHKIFYEYLKQHAVEHHRELRNAGWAFLNDAILTQLCLLFPSRTIAAAALYCAARHCTVALPDHPPDLPWWDAHGVSLADIRAACNYMVDCYEHTPLRPGMEAIYLNLRSPGEAEVDVGPEARDGDEGDEERTRLRAERTPLTPGAGGVMERSVSAESEGTRKRRRDGAPARQVGNSNGHAHGHGNGEEAISQPKEKRSRIEVPERTKMEEEAMRVKNGDVLNEYGRLGEEENVSEEGELDE